MQLNYKTITAHLIENQAIPKVNYFHASRIKLGNEFDF